MKLNERDAKVRFRAYALMRTGRPRSHLMMRTLYKICIGLIVALGLLHVSFTPFSRFTMGAMMFLAAGLAIVFAGFLNFVLLRDAGRDRGIQTLIHFSNVMMSALFTVGIFVLPEPQSFFGLGLFVLTTVLAFLLSRRARS